MIFSTKLLGIIISLLEICGIEVTNIDLFLNIDLGLAIVEFGAIIALLVYLIKTLSKIKNNSSRIVELLEKQSKEMEPVTNEVIESNFEKTEVEVEEVEIEKETTEEVEVEEETTEEVDKIEE